MKLRSLLLSSLSLATFNVPSSSANPSDPADSLNPDPLPTSPNLQFPAMRSWLDVLERDQLAEAEERDIFKRQGQQPPQTTSRVQQPTSATSLGQQPTSSSSQAQQSTSSTSSTSTISIPPTAAAGGLSWLTPAATAGTTYIKIAASNLVTFGWTLTSVIATPTSLTIQAFCSQNDFTYPVGPTTGIPGTQTTYVWDPYAYQQSNGVRQLIDAAYTLLVYDERGPSAGAKGGYMSPNSGLQFAMFNPQPYTPLASWTCAACSGSIGAWANRPNWKALAAMVGATAGAMLAGGLGVGFGRW